MIILLSILFGGVIILPLTAKWIWPAFENIFDIIWISPEDKIARRLLAKAHGNHVLPEMTATGEVEILSAQVGVPSDDVKRAIGALTAEDAAAIFSAIRTGRPLALVKILKILKLDARAALRMPKEG